MALVEWHPAVRHQDADEHMAPRVRPDLRRGLDEAAGHPEEALAEPPVEAAAAPEPDVLPRAVALDGSSKPSFKLYMSPKGSREAGGVSAHTLQIGLRVLREPKVAYLLADGTIMCIQPARQRQLAAIETPHLGFKVSNFA